MSGPLEGIKVVEFTGYIAGPGVGGILADLGADVIKVEPLRGDAARKMGPYGDAIWCNFNRGKRSLAVDLRTPEGRAIAAELIDRSDVLIQNLRPGAMARLGLDAEQSLARNPQLVYLSIAGYSSDGPNAERPGFDVASQAESGMMSLTGERKDGPLRIGYPVVDMASTHVGAEAVMAALLGRIGKGHGRAVEVSMFDVAVALQKVPLSTYLKLGVEPERTGNGQPHNAPSADVVHAQDGQVVISAYPDEHWARLCQAMGRPELATDERFVSNEARVANRPAMLIELNQQLGHLDSASVEQLLTDHAIVAGIVRTYPQLEVSEEFQKGNFVIDVSSADGVIGSSIRPAYTLTDGPLPSVLPAIGEHTIDILTELGRSAEDVASLTASGIVGVR